MINKSWEKPKLFVVVNGSPEEAVLLACKNTAPLAGSTFVDPCIVTTEAGPQECNVIGFS